jgi:hypothetical protein
VLDDLRALSAEELKTLEANLRPRAAAVTGFMGEDDDLLKLIATDVDALAAVGTTASAVGLRLAQLLFPETSSYYRMRETMREREHVPDHIEVRFGAFLKGSQHCPFRNEGCGHTCPRPTTVVMAEIESLGSGDFDIYNHRTGERVRGPGLLAHLALFHSFFEGSIRYRVDPVALARTMELV